MPESIEITRTRTDDILEKDGKIYRVIHLEAELKPEEVKAEIPIAEKRVEELRNELANAEKKLADLITINNKLNL